MSSDGDEIGVYLTNQKELEEHRRNQRNDNRNTQYFYEKEYEGEWDIPDSTPLPRQESDNGIYLTEMPNKKKDQNESPPDTLEPRPKKPVVQDLYDEDNYCLARSSDLDPHDNVPRLQASHADNGDAQEKKAIFSCSKKKIIIGVIASILLIGAAGGISVFLLAKSQGKLNHQLQLISSIHFTRSLIMIYNIVLCFYP